MRVESEGGKMRKRNILIVALLCMALMAGASCGTASENSEVNADKEIVSTAVEGEKSSSESVEISVSSPESTETSANGLELTHDKYTGMIGFEYNEEMLSQINEMEGIDDFEIYRNDGSITISGLISTRKVENEEYAIENIKMVRSLLGLVNPDEQLRFERKLEGIYSERYDFGQYYAGLRVYDAGVSVSVETDNQLITYTNSTVRSVELLEKTNLDGILSESEILEKYKGAEIKEMCIWTLNVGEPKVAYIVYQDYMTLIIDARTAEIIDEWSNIID